MARTNTQTVYWREEFNSELRELIAQKLSAQKIANVLNERHSLTMSRNVVIGQCHRQKLKLLGAPVAAKVIKPKPAPVRVVVVPPRPRLVRADRSVRPIDATAIPFMDRASYQCAFILGDHRQLPAMCCGKDVAWRKDGTPLSWCAEHRAIVYTASQPPQEPANESRRMQARAFG
jgi:hypothetical protein